MMLLQTGSRYTVNETHFIIFNTKLEDAGRYSCHIANEVGSALGSAWITVNATGTSSAALVRYSGKILNVAHTSQMSSVGASNKLIVIDASHSQRNHLFIYLFISLV